MRGRAAWVGGVIVGLVVGGVVSGIAQGPVTLTGFDSAGAAIQQQLEKQFMDAVRRDDLKGWLERLAAKPHHVGSPHDKENAEFIAELFKSWGFETQIERFDVLFPTPKARELELTAPTKYVARLAEPTIQQDPTSGQTAEQLPTYNAYSIDGDVTAPLVYVNYGVPADYETLERRGIDVKGKIVIARYGGSWRGIKPKVAAEHGAVGCLIYSDPRDDGYFQGDAYPKGPFRGEWGAQRGSVADMPVFAGDPLTPHVGATPSTKRLALSEAPTLTKIPVLPISYGDARPLLEALGGPVAPEQWRGALPLTYHLGPGPATVRLKLAFDFSQKPIYDVIATLTGSERPDQWVIRGNHHDAWVNGADDPTSGMVALLAEARAVGVLAKNGWRPKRTIVYAAWDGEEPGLLGSTEWVETHADELRQKAVAYINSDSTGRGFFDMGGSHGLETFINEVARDVVDPQTKVSIRDRARALAIVRASSDEVRRELRDRSNLRISALGSGSDYTPFLQHLGVASLNIGFSGEDSGGEYHSIYDSIAHYERFGDPGFAYGEALAKAGGMTTLRLAQAAWLPVTAKPLAETVGRYVQEVTKLAEAERGRIEEENRKVRERSLQLAADPTETFVPPPLKPEAPFINLSPLLNASAKLTSAAEKFDAAVANAKNQPRLTSADGARKLDALLQKLEPSLTDEKGLPRRPWFVHTIYAPGFYTGYGVKTLPGVREAIEQRAWSEAEQQAVQAAGAIVRAAGILEQATAVASGE
jgi:N-acetylated-alpha-linked acidic dipeptidase